MILQARRAAAVVIGAVAALAFAAPASAHTGQLTSEAPCTDTGWNAVWTLRTAGAGGHNGVLSDVEVDLGYRIPPPGGGLPGRDGSKLPVFHDGAEFSGDTTVSDTLKLNPSVTGATLTFTVTWTVGEDTHTRDLSETVLAPGNCDWPAPVEPSDISDASDCTSLTITLANPAAGKDMVTVRLKPSTGVERVLSAAAGQTRSETFPGTAGLTVEITQDGVQPPPGGGTVVSYDRPRGCAIEGTPSGEGGGESDGGTLPVTGANGGNAGIAAGVLLAAGVVLILVFRRRSTTFTA